MALMLHLKPESAQHYGLADIGNGAGGVEDIPRERLIVVALGNVEMICVVDMFDFHAARELVDTVGKLALDDVGGVMFILNVAADLLHQVLESDHAGGAAEFVDDHGDRPFLR